jgi:hypothetical protein
MVRALEEIAEEEQILMMKEEAAAAQTPDLIKTSKKEDSDSTSPMRSTTPQTKEKKPIEGKVEGGKAKKKSDLQDYYI